MYKIKFDDLIINSNNRKVLKKKTILFFYGLGCSSNDFNFLIRSINKKFQILIPELPGHHRKTNSRNSNLNSYTKKIFLFIKKKKLRKIIFFAHSVGGIIPILLAKRFLKKKIFKNFINYEGNLTHYDTSTITKKTVSYSKEIFNEKYNNLISICSSSKEVGLRKWSESLKKTSPDSFYNISKDAVSYSNSGDLMRFYKSFFNKRIYLYGEKSNFFFSEFLFGSIRYKIYDCGHFSFYENSYEFRKIFNKSINERNFK
tara:strand:- start:4055 stop:4828 length:774 start_codon:yes stop_codon:yes gene_type:complete